MRDISRDEKGKFILEQYKRYMFNNNFIKILEYMSNGISLLGESVGYIFAKDCDEEDDYSFDKGVMFYFRDERIIISDEEFYEWIKKTTKLYNKIFLYKNKGPKLNDEDRNILIRISTLIRKIVNQLDINKSENDWFEIW